MSLQLISLNTRGLRDALKRKTVFNYYRERANLICLQETHSTAQDEVIWQSEWGGKIYYSHGTSSA